MPDDWTSYLPSAELRFLLAAAVVALVLSIAAWLFGRLLDRVIKPCFIPCALLRSIRMPMQLRCYPRESLLAYINHNYPGALPKVRATLNGDEAVDEPPPGTHPAEIDHQPPV